MRSCLIIAKTVAIDEIRALRVEYLLLCQNIVYSFMCR